MTDNPFVASPPTDPLAYEIWLDGIVRLVEGAKLRNVQASTLKRDALRNGELLQLSERAVGVRRRFALMLPPREGGRGTSRIGSRQRSRALRTS
jgi:hypothetical protein